MQSYSLTVDKFLDHAAKWWGDRQIVEAEAGHVIRRSTYASLRTRSNLLSGALKSFGLNFGDRIGTLAWNTQHHLEIYYAAMGAGFICHTLNPRLTVLQLAGIINEAEDRILAAASNLLPLVRELAPLCSTIEHVILMDGEASPSNSFGNCHVWSYEGLLNARGAPVTWGNFEEETPAGLCYTSGTTAAPKGVLYTHRSNYLHTMRALQADATAMSARDTVLVAVPMFHANGWGYPFAAPAVGAKIVLPGRHTDGASLASLMREENVTIAAGVYTVWLGVCDYLDAEGGELPELERVLIGGANCPGTLIRRIEQRLGAQVQTSWGMTELSPLGTITPVYALSAEAHGAGRAPMGLDLKLTDAQGRTLAQQRGVVGHLKVKGASVVDRYFKGEPDILDGEGYFDTGDLAMIGEAGDLTICGRSKDLIKSGGEWINPAEIEAIVGRHPAVRQVAVIGRADPKWGERPVLIVEPRQSQDVEEQVLVESLRGKVADWWIPDQVALISSMPLAATGKVDKNQLRADYANGAIIGKSVRR